MTIDELCDAINEAKIVKFEDVQNAVSEMTMDLGRMIAETDKLYYLHCESTNFPYINQSMNAMIFSDEYFAEKYVDNRTELKLSTRSIDKNNKKTFFCYLLQSGIDTIDFCSSSKAITLSINKHVYEGMSGINTAAPELTKYVSLTAQTVRSNAPESNNNRLIKLLMANTIASIQDSVILVPIHFEGPVSLKTVNKQVVQNIPKELVYTIQTMKTPSGDTLFPVFTNIFEFAKTNPDSLLCIATPVREYMKFVKTQIASGLSAGIICNPSSVSVIWNQETINTFLDGFEGSSND